MLALLSACVTSAYANDLVSMPALGNTDGIDHALSREVADDFVFTGEPIDALPPTPLAKAIASAESIELPLLSEATPHAPAFISTGSVIWDLIRKSDELNIGEQYASGDVVDSSSDDQLTVENAFAKYKALYIEKAYFTNLMLERSRPYIAHLVKSLDQRYLPVELSLLPAIESGFQPHSVSKNNAVGLWQIVPITAREIGITRNRWFDGRADIVTSTVAAIDYLSYLNAEFNGDWELTLAAYNAGPSRVKNAVRKNLETGKDTRFAALDLPKETRNYVPKFAALVALIKDPTQTSLTLPKVAAEDAFEVLNLDTRVSLDQLSSLTQLPQNTLSDLNPGLVRGVTPAKGPHTVYVPAGKAEFVAELVAKADPSELFLVPQSHTVVAGETLGGIALLYGMSTRQLQIINHLDSDRIRIDQDLSVVDSRFIEQPKLVQYTVTSGDTLSDIAAQFSVNISDVVAGSGDTLDTDVIRPGDKLQIRVVSPDVSVEVHVPQSDR